MHRRAEDDDRSKPIELHAEPLGEARSLRIAAYRGRKRLSWRDAIEGWQHDETFCRAFCRALAEAPHEAFFWEAAPVRRETVVASFECVLTDSPALSRLAPDPAPFERRLASAGGAEAVAVFPNLGGDALLVVPAERSSRDRYPHLARFVRSAPEGQVLGLWRAVGRALEERLEESPSPCWVSTSGLGVAWVHVRLDSQPKYYVHAPYRRVPPP